MMPIASLRRIAVIAGALAFLASAAPPAFAKQAPAAKSDARKCKGSSCRQSTAQRGGGGGGGGSSGAYLFSWRIGQALRP
jgi:hypothetical protein